MDFPPEVDWDDVLSLADVMHVEYMREHGKYEPDVVSVFDLQKVAAEIADTYYAGQYGSDVAKNKLAVTYGAALLYTFDRYGLPFETLQNLISYDFSQLLASISGDNRLPRAQRIVDMQSRVARASTAGQLIKLSEMVLLYQKLSDIRSLLLALPKDRHIRREFVERAIDYLEIAARLCTTMNNLKDNKSFVSALMQHKAKFKQLVGQWEAARSFVDDPEHLATVGKTEPVPNSVPPRTSNRCRRTSKTHRSKNARPA